LSIYKQALKVFNNKKPAPAYRPGRENLKTNKIEKINYFMTKVLMCVKEISKVYLIYIF